MHTALIWFGFFFSITVMLVIARKNLWLGITVAAFVIGKFSLSFGELAEQAKITLTDPSVILIALAMGLIPIIGGAMEKAGLMDDLINNLPFRRKLLLAFSSALVGLLPMPGGALLSAPLVERGGRNVNKEIKAAINVWYRHVFLLIYPLGMLLATSAMAGVNLYAAILYLLPGFAIMLLLGNWFLLSKVANDGGNQPGINTKKTIIPILIFVIAPLIHVALMNIFKNWIREIPLLIGVLSSIILTLYVSRLSLKNVRTIVIEMRPWKFSLIIIAMFLFLNIFKASETSRVIAATSFSKEFLLIGMGAVLGFATGRVQVPFSILLPIFLTQYGAGAMTPLVFALTFFAIYQGYLISPVHPCTSVSMEYFNTSLKSFYRLSAMPAMICLAVAWVLSMILL